MHRSRFLTSLALAIALPLALPTTSIAQTGGISKVRISTSLGDIEAELYADKAPKTVANFLQYVKDKHYDGTVFHRVITGFMVQGGGYDAKYKEKKTRPPVQHEGRQALAAGLKNTTGTLAMARTNDPQSATAQFFINVVDPVDECPSAVWLHRFWQSHVRHGRGPKNQDHPHRGGRSFPIRCPQDAGPHPIHHFVEVTP
jgi:peptidyl-prolyl cis-trans isomerase A (cyclophilin A)